jgi:thiamine biosynthesis lipoprotein
VEVRDNEAIFTSGNYARFRQDATQRYAHILDPRTGWPTKDIASVTVISNEGLLADAAATALVVAGLDDWPAVAKALNLDQVAVVDESGTVFLTTAMQRRINLSENVRRVVVDTLGK